jgi:hypothetical protein
MQLKRMNVVNEHAYIYGCAEKTHDAKFKIKDTVNRDLTHFVELSSALLH